MENSKKIIYEEVLSEDYLSEMGQVYPKSKPGEFSILVGYSPETYDGNPYFKVYNHPTKYQSATKVIRINFKTPTVVTGHAERNGKQEWKLRDFGSKYREELVDYLNSKSKVNPNISVWTQLRFEWNMMKGFDIDDVDSYMNQVYDKKYLNNPNYIPYNFQMPDYVNELRNDNDK